jgi:hypothetical protein
VLGEGLSLGDTDGDDVDVGGEGVLTGLPLHAAASTNAKAHIARRMSGSVSGPT